MKKENGMSKIKLVILGVVLLLFFGMEAGQWEVFETSKEIQERPNIILFLVDDMGLMDTSVPMLADESGKPKRHPLNDWYRTSNMESAEHGSATFTLTRYVRHLASRY
jgi:hypothetical protein